MTEETESPGTKRRPPWWRSIGPALITACVVFGPGSLLISSNVGAEHGYQLLWMLIMTGVLMGTYLTMAARIGVAGGATPCTLVARHAGRWFAAIIGINLCLICTAFQFSNNLAFSAAAETLVPSVAPSWFVVGLNAVLVVFLFAAKSIYKIIERFMKITVGIILVCFLVNLIVAGPAIVDVLAGFVPSWPASVAIDLPRKMNDPMILIASLLGTTFSVAAAFYQGNLVREKGWTIKEYNRGIGDSIAGVAVLTGVSMIIMITTATVIPGRPAENIGTLAETLRPLLGTMAHAIFCIGLLVVAINPFLINAMIGGGILADGIGKSPRLNDRWPRVFTVGVLLVGMVVAMLSLRTGRKPVELIIFGQAMTVLGNPLLAGVLLWLANKKAVMGDRRNRIVTNVLGGIGFIVVLLMTVRVLFILGMKLS